MSLFKVSLNNEGIGQLDPSMQRSIFITGPKGVHRKLKDGDTFTDCNYWKRFAYPQVKQEEAFIVVLEDDGSIYSDIKEENNFPVVYTKEINNGTDYSDNILNFLNEHGGPAIFTQINNMGEGDVKIRINGSNSAVFDLSSDATQVFNYGDLTITKLEIKNESGSNSKIQTIASIRSVEKS
jgi:hypothetical protein